jgi:hypothetical protein
MAPDPIPPPAGGHRFLRCPTCGRSTEVNHDELMRHSRDGWPKCCGQVMDYLTPSVGRCPTCGRAGGLIFPLVTPPGSSVQIVCLMCALSPDSETKS